MLKFSKDRKRVSEFSLNVEKFFNKRSRSLIRSALNSFSNREQKSPKKCSRGSAADANDSS